MTAAIPGGRRHQAPTTYHEFPGDAAPLVCPHCRSDDELVLYAATPVEYEVAVYRAGVTTPQFDVTATVVPTPAADPKVIEGIGCRACRWAYKGPDALAKLVPSE